jgi:Ca-activated chloride channel family protein
MSLIWSGALLLLLLLPLLVLLYFWILRRRRRYALRYSSLSLIRQALPERSSWRRHIPAALYLSALISLILAFARPVTEVQVPLSRTTIILAMDISRSMCAVDVPPNRLTVAQDAAISFIEEQADGTLIGLVAFADFAEIVVPPTEDREALEAAVETLSTSIGTAIGSATLKGIDAIAEIKPEMPPSGVNLGVDGGEAAGPSGPYQPDIIVLLTDGANTRGPRPVDAAQQAADRGLRVYTIGFGTTERSEMVCSQEQMGGDAFGGFSGFGRFGGFSGGNFQRYLLLDEPTLREVAEITGGGYFRAVDAEQLLQVFRELPKRIELQVARIEISVAFTALGAMLLLLATGLSWHWNWIT